MAERGRLVGLGAGLMRFGQCSERRKTELKENGFQLHSWRRPWGPPSEADPAAAPAVGSPALLLPRLMAAGDLGNARVWGLCLRLYTPTLTPPFQEKKSEKDHD